MKEEVRRRQLNSAYKEAANKYFPDGNDKIGWYNRELIKRIPECNPEELKIFWKKRDVCCFVTPNFRLDPEARFDVDGTLSTLSKGSIHASSQQATSKHVYLPKETLYFTIPKRKWREELFTPTNFFPTYNEPLYHPLNSVLSKPNVDCDVYTLSDPISKSVHNTLCNALKKLGDETQDFPVPNYHNIIDPNLLVFGDQWIATEFLIEEVNIWTIAMEILLQKASLQLIGEELPQELIEMIRLYCVTPDYRSVQFIDDHNDADDFEDLDDDDVDNEKFNNNNNQNNNNNNNNNNDDELDKENYDPNNRNNEKESKTNYQNILSKRINEKKQIKKLTAKLMGPIHDLNPKKNGELFYCIQEVFQAALPLLARLRKPSLLLPGILQAVIKAQKIYLSEGEEYSGVLAS